MHSHYLYILDAERTALCIGQCPKLHTKYPWVEGRGRTHLEAQQGLIQAVLRSPYASRVPKRTHGSTRAELVRREEQLKAYSHAASSNEQRRFFQQKRRAVYLARQLLIGRVCPKTERKNWIHGLAREIAELVSIDCPGILPALQDRIWAWSDGGIVRVEGMKIAHRLGDLKYTCQMYAETNGMYCDIEDLLKAVEATHPQAMDVLRVRMPHVGSYGWKLTPEDRVRAARLVGAML